MPAQPTTPTLLEVAANAANWQDTLNTALAGIVAHLKDGPLPVKVYTLAGLPDAASWQYCITFVSDPAGDKGNLVLSDGTNWRYVSDASAV